MGKKPIPNDFKDATKYILKNNFTQDTYYFIGTTNKISLVCDHCGHSMLLEPHKHNFIGSHTSNSRCGFGGDVYDHVIIEFFGDYWHCNPKMWDNDRYNKTLKMTASEKWKKDEARLKQLQTNPSKQYSIIVVWEKTAKTINLNEFNTHLNTAITNHGIIIRVISYGNYEEYKFVRL